jgi:hypothetical protein
MKSKPPPLFQKNFAIIRANSHDKCCLRKKKGVLYPASYIYSHSSDGHNDIIMLIATRKHSSDRVKMTSALLIATMFDSSDGQRLHHLGPSLLTSRVTNVGDAHRYYAA